MQKSYTPGFPGRLKAAREKVALSQTAFAERVDSTKQNVAAYEQGRAEPDLQFLANVVAVTRVDMDWLITGKGEMEVERRFEGFLESAAGSRGKKLVADSLAEYGGGRIELQKIPVFEYTRAGSKSLVLDGQPAFYIATSKSRDDSRFGVAVKGKSMEPEVRDGEVVVVSKKREVKNGDVCLVLFEDGDACLRRVYFHDHGVTLTSTNEKEYPPSLHKKSDIRIMYRMVQKITNY